MKKSILLSLFIFSFSFCEGQSWNWAKGGPVGSVAEGNGLSADNNGNVYISGFQEYNSSSGFLWSKYDSTGNLLWMAQPNNQVPSETLNGCCDLFGNSFTVGSFADTLIVDSNTLINSQWSAF